MQAFLTIVAIALLPAGANVVGALLAESVRTPAWLIGAALHAAAGIAIAVVSVNLMPRILGGLSPWLMALAFLVGVAFSVMLAAGVAKLRARFGSGEREAAGPWMVYTAGAADLSATA